MSSPSTESLQQHHLVLQHYDTSMRHAPVQDESMTPEIGPLFVLICQVKIDKRNSAFQAKWKHHGLWQVETAPWQWQRRHVIYRCPKHLSSPMNVKAFWYIHTQCPNEKEYNVKFYLSHSIEKPVMNEIEMMNGSPG